MAGMSPLSNIIKKSIFVFIFVMTIPSMTMGFDFTIGVKLGVSFNSYAGSDYEEILDAMEEYFKATYGDDFDFQTKNQFGFSGGIYATIGLHPNLAIQPEILYTMAGGAYGWDRTTNYYGGTTHERIKFFEFPVLVIGRVPISKTFGINLLSGPNLGIRVRKVDWENVQGGETVAEGEMDEEYARFVLGVLFGGGFTIYTKGKATVSVETRYSLGLTPVVNEDEFGVDDWKQNNFQILFGFGYALSKGSSDQHETF
jgi:hypothetical protein